MTHLLHSKGFNGFPHKCVASNQKNLYILSLSCIFHDNCIPRLLDLHDRFNSKKENCLLLGILYGCQPIIHGVILFLKRKEKKTPNAMYCNHHERVCQKKKSWKTKQTNKKKKQGKFISPSQWAKISHHWGSHKGYWSPFTEACQDMMCKSLVFVFYFNFGFWFAYNMALPMLSFHIAVSNYTESHIKTYEQEGEDVLIHSLQRYLLNL